MRTIPNGSGLREATRANFEYLVATLSQRTRGKKYENFVVNYIWNSLGDDTLKPVTQQYVNRRMERPGLGLVDIHREGVLEEDAHHALIDLYFPALRLGAECDERHHAGSARGEDLQRTADIGRAIPGYEEIRVLVEFDDVRAACTRGRSGDSNPGGAMCPTGSLPGKRAY